jgi:hypothetical protein
LALIKAYPSGETHFVARIAGFDPGWESTKRTLRAYLPVLGSFGTAAVVASATGRGPSFNILAVVAAMGGGRVAASGSRRSALTAAAALPLVGLGAAVVGSLMIHSLTAAGALYTAVIGASIAARRFGPTAARFGRLASLPLLAVFIAPVPVGGSFGSQLPWSALACAIAAAWTLFVSLVLVPDRPVATLRAAARALPSAPSVGARRRAIAVLDAQARRLAAAPQSPAARAALRRLRLSAFDAELAIEGAPALVPRPTDALARLRDQALTLPPLGPPAGSADPAPARRPPRGGISASTRLGLQSSAAIGLAFLVGYRLFPDHWGWTVITVLAVTGGVRSRGDVLHRSLLRLLGALAGTVAATGLTIPLEGHRHLAIAAIFVLLLAGTIARERTYAAWAFCVTGMLALLYGLYGQVGMDLLETRLEAIVVGAACAVVPAWLLLPVRTESVVRVRLADALAALDTVVAAATVDVLAALDGLRDFDRRLADLRTAVRSARPPVRRWADLAAAVRPAARELVVAARDPDGVPESPLADVRRMVGATRHAVGRRAAAAPPPPEPNGVPAVLALDGALRSLHACLA